MNHPPTTSPRASRPRRSFRPAKRLSLMLAAAGAVVLASFNLPMSAQESPAARAPLFSSSTDLVVMNIVVQDRNGTLVPGLSRDAFTVLENNLPRPIDLFAGHDEPITLGLVIDSSGSMLANRARLAYAVSRFAETGRSDDEVFALVVGDAVKPVLPPDRPFTSSPEVLRSAVFGALGSLGRTAIWDGVLEGLAYLERGSHSRRALVVISDGQDNASQASFEEVLSRVRSSSAAVYTMGLIDPMNVNRRPRSLRLIARSSGGEAYFPESHQAAMAALETIARQIHSAYTLGFAPAARDRDGRYHTLAVRVRGTAGQALKAHSRAGYLASHDQPAER